MGVGQADSKPAATEQAYAAVARVFKAEVTAQSKDWESFLVMEQRGHVDTERRLTLDQVTKVSTDKVLENVGVIDSWNDKKNRQYYVLAGMNRSQAGSALQERIMELDRAVEAEITESRQTSDKLTKVRNLRRAIKDLVLREAYNSDLRVIRLSGQGLQAAYRVPDLTSELEQFLSSNLIIGVEVMGEQAEPTRHALMEGLIREGLPVTDRLDETLEPDGPNGKAPELLIKGSVHLWDVSVADPRFRYARWCGDFVIVEKSTQRIVGAVSSGGREGHITPGEARAKAARMMQQELASHLAKTLAAYIYGETDPPPAAPASACPKEDRAIQPPAALRPL
jgi:hypothetical protein